MLLSRTARFLTLLLAAMQFAAPAVVSVADGAFAKSVRDPSMHVEANGDNECTPPHSADCTMCRYLSDASGEAPGHPAADIVVESHAAPSELTTAESYATRDGFDARGPPAIAG